MHEESRLVGIVARVLVDFGIHALSLDVVLFLGSMSLELESGGLRGRSEVYGK